MVVHICRGTDFLVVVPAVDPDPKNQMGSSEARIIRDACNRVSGILMKELEHTLFFNKKVYKVVRNNHHIVKTEIKNVKLKRELKEAFGVDI